MNKRYASLLAIFVIAGLISISIGNQTYADSPTPTPTYFGVAGIEVTDEELAVTPEPTVSSQVASAQTPYSGPPTITYEAADTDGDTCPDGFEGGEDPARGGARDATNPWDYFNPTHDGLNRVDDILVVVNAYFHDDNDGNPGLPPYAAGYTPDTDRMDDPGSSEGWDLLGPNGLQRVDDILASVKQYFHDCSLVEIDVNVAQDCGGIILEAGEVTKGTWGCKVRRNQAGEIIDIFRYDYVEVAGVPVDCVDCASLLPGIASGTWHSENTHGEQTYKWPPVGQVCSWSILGFRVCVPVPQITFVKYRLECSWDWYDEPGHIYDKATANHQCHTEHRGVTPYRWDGEGETEEGHVHLSPITGTLTWEARATGNFSATSFGGILTLWQFQIIIYCDMGPGSFRICWRTENNLNFY